jgi:hypothetical protein
MHSIQLAHTNLTFAQKKRRPERIELYPDRSDQNTTQGPEPERDIADPTISNSFARKISESLEVGMRDFNNFLRIDPSMAEELKFYTAKDITPPKEGNLDNQRSQEAFQSEKQRPPVIVELLPDQYRVVSRGSDDWAEKLGLPFLPDKKPD